MQTRKEEAEILTQTNQAPRLPSSLIPACWDHTCAGQAVWGWSLPIPPRAPQGALHSLDTHLDKTCLTLPRAGGWVDASSPGLGQQAAIPAPPATPEPRSTWLMQPTACLETSAPGKQRDQLQGVQSHRALRSPRGRHEPGVVSSRAIGRAFSQG